jgi:hypothetical protein
VEAAAAFKHPRLRIGALLLRSGLLSAEQLAEALEEKEETGQRIGEIVIRRGWVSDGDMARTLAEQFHLEFIDLDAAPPDESVAGLLPPEVARHLEAVPVRVLDDGAILVAVADPVGEALEGLPEALGLDVRLGVAPASAIGRAIGAVEDATDQVAGPSVESAEAPAEDVLDRAGEAAVPVERAEPEADDEQPPLQVITPFEEASEESVALFADPAGIDTEPGSLGAAPHAVDEAAPEPAEDSGPELAAVEPPAESPATQADAELPHEELLPPTDQEQPDEHVAEEPAQPIPFMLRRPLLGTLLLRDGLLSPQQLAEALIEKEETEERLGEILLRRGWITEEAVAQALAEQYTLPYVDLAADPPEDRAARLLSAALARYFRAVPLRHLDDETVLVAIADPTAFGVDNLERALSLRVELALATESAIEHAIAHLETEEEALRPTPVPSPEPVLEPGDEASVELGREGGEIPESPAAAERPETADDDAGPDESAEQGLVDEFPLTGLP